ncbi:hypothetical protein R1sor_019873 [Riccia sorocarpa]|uniref:Uncharacterized protein n=1 Tax=Riccia sorocarpa TaxID=122646 RepID=A0ABD3IEV8_9MARC
MPGKGFLDASMDGEVLKSLIIQSRTSLAVGGMVGGFAGSGDHIGSFSSGSQNGRVGLEASGYASNSSKSHNGGVWKEVESAPGLGDTDSRDLEIVKGITYTESSKNEISGNSSDVVQRSRDSNLSVSQKAEVIEDEMPNDGYMQETESESGTKSFEDNGFGNESKEPKEEKRRPFPSITPARTDADSAKPWKLQDKVVFEDRAGNYLEDTPPQADRNGEDNHRSSDAGVSFDGRSADKLVSSACRHEEHRHSRGSGAGIPNPALVERLYNPPHVCNHVRCAANNPDYALKHETPAKKFLVAKKHPYGGARRRSCDHEGGSTERARTCCCGHDRESTEKPRRASSGCEGGTSGKTRISSGYGGGSAQKSRTTSDGEKRHVLSIVNNTEASGDKPRRISADGERSKGINTPASKSKKSSVDSDRSNALSTSSASRQKRGKSTLLGLTPPGQWNSSVALDKKPGDRKTWSSVIIEKKHGNQTGWNSSVAVERKQADCYYGPWNGSVAIEKKKGEKKDKTLTSSPIAAKQSSEGGLLHTSRRTSSENMEDRRRKPRRSSIASDLSEASAEVRSSDKVAVGAEESSGSARVSASIEEGRSPPRTITPRTGYEASPSPSVGSNHSETSYPKHTGFWKQRQSSPDSSCATGGDSPSCESLSSVNRSSDSRADCKARYEQSTASSKLPRFPSSYTPRYLSASVNGKLPALKPSWNSSISRVPLISERRAPVASAPSKATLAKNFIAKLKESTRAAEASASWNSSFTVAPSLFIHSTKGSAASKITRKTEAKQSNTARKGTKEVEEQVNKTLKGEKVTPPPEDSVSIPLTDNSVKVPEEMTVPIPESSAEKHIDPGSVVSVPSTPSPALTRSGNISDGATSTPYPTKLSETPSTTETEESKVQAALKFGKKGRTVRIEEQRTSETVSLKKNEMLERRLSEEYMTDHTLSTIKRDIQGGRVKSLVHAFESLKAGPDLEHHHSADETVRSEYERELAALAPPASPTPA